MALNWSIQTLSSDTMTFKKEKNNKNVPPCGKFHKNTWPLWEVNLTGASLARSTLQYDHQCCVSRRELALVRNGVRTVKQFLSMLFSMPGEMMRRATTTGVANDNRTLHQKKQGKKTAYVFQSEWCSGTYNHGWRPLVEHNNAPNVFYHFTASQECSDIVSKGWLHSIRSFKAACATGTITARK